MDLRAVACGFEGRSQLADVRFGGGRRVDLEVVEVVVGSVWE